MGGNSRRPAFAASHDIDMGGSAAIDVDSDTAAGKG